MQRVPLGVSALARRRATALLTAFAARWQCSSLTHCRVWLRQVRVPADSTQAPLPTKANRMTASSSTPDHPTHGDRGAIGDAVPDNWVDRLAPSSWRPYFRLARLDRPIGLWLLVFPCWWSVALAGVSDHRPYPNLWFFTLFLAGAVVMRGCGCAYNDYVDRDIDAKVARTASRPIPSGQVSSERALAFAVALAFVGLAVLVQFNLFTILLGIGSLTIVAVYPFAKRYTDWAQLVLGLAFNWGALVGWSAVKGSIGWPAVLLYLGSVAWTVGYDTIYAHQDREDDRALGLRSTALRFGENTQTWLGALYGIAVVFWLAAGFMAGAHLIFVTAVVLVSLQLSWQVSTLDVADAGNCLRRFRSNRDVGIALLLGLVTDMALSWFAGLS
jgi:4-hydroxybenzoate polyprenyltransferase